MRFLGLGRAVALAAMVWVGSAQAQGAGDLLVAPTRVVLDGARGTEVILNNIGSAPATYRISLELRRMAADGHLEDIDPATASDKEKATLAMISYAPRRVVLPPNQPQSIRIGIRAPEGLADGEYRAHMLFRAIPDAKPVVADPGAPKSGVSISLTPIYGVTIPIIVRKGSLTATAALSDARVDLKKVAGGPDQNEFSFALARNGTRSTYGSIRVTKQGADKPLIEARGIAVYAESATRRVAFPVEPALAAALRGPVRIEYLQDIDAGGGTIASLQAVIR
jgi:hypothetical protein